MDLKCAFRKPRAPEPILVLPPVLAPERLPLRRGRRADLIGDPETTVPVPHFRTRGAEYLLLVHVAKLVEFRLLCLVACPLPAAFLALRAVSGMIWHGRRSLARQPVDPAACLIKEGCPGVGARRHQLPRQPSSERTGPRVWSDGSVERRATGRSRLTTA